ncbi:pilus assembly protein [Dyella amyloliquefaciens]|uniref:pilus assembly protein n=1 Tax=Dyella amyloliquefaciens TaxID=1770545 RepID=UPI00102E4B0E|nr:PilC/PilY family type IV pilus protein [Dyella amyloliquefaciens]
MNTKPHALRRRSSAAIRAMGTMLVVWMLGSLYTPAVAATTTVTVDQQPLTVQPMIPPNVVLMLDDSGSMSADYMPDLSYLNNNTNNDALIDSSNNGLYYNPTVIYTPPPLVSGVTNTTYTDMTAVPHDGLAATLVNVNLFTYNGSYECSDTQSCGTGKGSIAFNTSTQHAVLTGGTTNYSQTVTSSGSGGSTIYADAVCQNTANTYTGVTNYQFTGTTKNSGGKWTKGTCTFTYQNTTQKTVNYFQYSTGPAAGTYTDYYVALNTGDCAYAPTPANCVLVGDTTGAAAPAKDASGNQLTAGQNIANWFAYYHTRILMAKSGLMTVFASVDPSFRVGFGSINGSGASWISSNINSNKYSFSTTTNSSNYLAQVSPFGDGKTGVQRANFWNWISQLSPGNSTPLRMALAAVGSYYKTSQPWSTLSSDPTYGTANASTNIACRQSYTIMTTDGFWNESYSSTTIAGATNAAWASVPGPNGQSWPTPAGSKPGVPFAGGTTGTTGNPSLADVALYYWENDLADGKGSDPNIANEVPTSKDDPAFWQHMVTFTMGLGFTPTGISGTASNGDSPPTTDDIFNAVSGKTTLSNFSWPVPSGSNNGSINNIADLEHAGVNGHGGFFSATSPQTFVSGLTNALNRASSRVGSGASLAANSTQLTNGTVAYQAQYHTVEWTGELMALPINSSTGAISTTANWSATTQLLKSATVTGSVITYPSRKIWTYVPPASPTSSGTFVSFANSSSTSPPSLSTAELNALGSTATAQATMVNYLRGDNTSEQGNSGTLRTRTTPLGDIVDSQPVYSGAPNPNEFENQLFTGMSNTASTGDNSFQAFSVGTTTAGVTTPSVASTRAGLVFVAANDGMLHAFDASTGNEVYAYLPGAVITAGNVMQLSNTSYGSTTSSTAPHQYYNDGELTIADAFFGSAWHTVLVGTTGRGLAKAVYALDITDPTKITPLWERSAGDGLPNSNYIGQMVGKPVIAKVQDLGTSDDWQVLIGNGYNSSIGQAALLEFNLATGALSVHTTDSTTANGLAAPVTWMDNPANGISMEAYAGDLGGRVWLFPLDTATTKTSGTTTTTTYAADLSTGGTKEFSATDPSGTAQPITAGMLAGRDPVTGYVWVFFGTGQYLTSADTTNTQVQSWYGVIVQPASNASPLPDLPAKTSDSSMVQRYITYEQDGDPTATPPTLGVRTVTTLPVPSDMAGKRGWYMNLQQPAISPTGSVSYNKQGERMVSPNQFQGNLLLGTTRIPQGASSSDICNPSGSGWVMAVDPFTGTNPSGNFFMVNGTAGSVTLPNGSVVAAAGVGFSSLPNNPIFVGGDMLMSFDNGTTSSLSTSGAAGFPQRVSWKELVNP